MFSYPLLDDIERAWSKAFKKEPTAMDLLQVFSILQEPATGIPTETILRYYGYANPAKTAKSKWFKSKSKTKWF